MQTIEEYLDKLEEYVLLLGGDKNLVDEYASHLYAEFEDFVDTHPKEAIPEAMFIRQLELPEVIAQSLVGASYEISSESQSLDDLVKLLFERIKKSKLMFLGILVTFVTGLQTLGSVRQEILPEYLLDILYRLRPDLRIPLSLIIPYVSLRELLQSIPFYVLTMLAFFLLYKITAMFLKREKRADSSLVYSLNEAIIILWPFGMIGAAITISFARLSPYTRISSSIPLMLLYVFIAPSIPVFIVLFQIAYQNLFSFQFHQLQKRYMLRANTYSQYSFSLHLLILIVFAVTATQSFIIDLGRSGVVWILGLDIYHLSLILYYFFVYKISSMILIKEKKTYQTSNYSLRLMYILLIISSMIGVVSIFLYKVLIDPWTYQDTLWGIYNWVEYWFPPYSFPLLIAFLVPALIVLFQMAYNNLFRSQFHYGKSGTLKTVSLIENNSHLNTQN
ncbi:MAG: hypothetical protein ACFFDI_26625 [Promethearchaeota archaeon]